MAFTPLSGTSGYVGTPRPAKRPYTRTPTSPGLTDRGTNVRHSVTQGTHPLNVHGIDPTTGSPQAPPTTQQAAPPPRVSQTATQANAAGAAADGMEAYLAGITDPNERAFVAAQIGPQIAALRAQQAALTAQLQQEQAAIASLTSAMAGQIGGLVGNAGGAYSNIAGMQIGSGKASGKGMADVGGGVSAENAAILGAIGAPSSQISGLAGLDKNVFTVGGKILAGVGGTIPAWATNMTGEGVSQWAAAQPAVAAAYGNDTLRQLQYQTAVGQADLQNKVGEVVGGIPGIRSDYQDQLDREQARRESRAMTLYNAGIYTQRQLAEDLGLPNPGSYPNTVKGSGPTAPKVQRIGNTLVAISTDPRTGALKVTPIWQGPTAPPKPPTVKGGPSTGFWRQNADGSVTVLSQPHVRLQTHNIGGELWAVDPYTGQKKVDLGPAGNPRATTTGPGGANPGGKNSYYIYNARAKGWQLKPGYSYGPGGLIIKIPKPGTTTVKPKKILAPDGTAYGQREIASFRDGVRGDIARFRSRAAAGKATSAELAGMIDHWRSQGVPPEIWQSIYAQTFRIPRNLDAATLSNMPIGRLHGIAMALAPKDFASSPKPRKSGYSKQELIQFITSHVSVPKVDAAAETAAGVAGSRIVTLARQQIGQPYVWGGESRKEGGFDCSGLVDWAMRQEGYKGPRVTTWTLAKMGTSVKGQELAPGDLIISNGGKHVTIYAGNNTIIAAPHRGSKVQYQSMPSGIVDIRRLSVGAAQNPPANAPWDANKARTPAGARQVGKAMALNYGWGGGEWAALNALWGGESSWDYTIHNRQGSGAVGIPQYLPSAHGAPPGDYLTNPITQIRWGLDYIKSRYGSPSKALAFKRTHNWY